MFNFRIYSSSYIDEHYYGDLYDALDKIENDWNMPNGTIRITNSKLSPMVSTLTDMISIPDVEYITVLKLLFSNIQIINVETDEDPSSDDMIRGIF